MSHVEDSARVFRQLKPQSLRFAVEFSTGIGVQYVQEGRAASGGHREARALSSARTCGGTAAWVWQVRGQQETVAGIPNVALCITNESLNVYSAVRNS